MRLGILIDEIRFGGVEKVAIEEVKALRALGHQAQLIVLKRTSSGAFADILKDVERIYFSDLLPRPIRLSFKLPFFRFFSFFHVSFALFARFVPLRTQLDAVVAHGTYTCFSGVGFARAMSIPLISFVWDPITFILRSSYFGQESTRRSLISPLMLAVGRLLDNWICKNSTKILTGSGYHLASLRQLSRADPYKVSVLFPGVHIRASIQSRRKPRVVLATAWKKGKDPQYILELVRRIKKLRFIFVGGWLHESMKKEFLREIANNGFAEQVSVIGSVDETELLELYSESLAFLQAKPDIGFGLPALEAAGQGCTFIIPKGQGVCDLFVHGDDGFIVAEKNTNQIVEFLQQFSENPAKAIEMGTSAWRRAKAYSWTNHAEILYTIALAVCRDSGIRPEPALAAILHHEH
jgi:glycosyltransferase involved in cell wall biosynthesis